MNTVTRGMLSVEIAGPKGNAQNYGVDILFPATGEKVVRLSKADGTTYEVTQGAEWTTCDCPDHKARHEGLRTEGCKHVRALVGAGLVELRRPTAVADASQAADADAPEPSPDTIDAPSLALTEKYRPRTLGEIRGQDEIVEQLTAFVERPYSTAFVFAGGTGTGKTSAALALARDLGVDVEELEWGGLYQIGAGEQIAENVREVVRKTRTSSMGSKSGWRVLIVSEADRMSQASEYLWLDELEQLAGKTVVIFTTNHPEKMSARILHRCEMMEFCGDAMALQLDAQGLVNDVWYAETGRTDAPRVEALRGAMDDGELSFRAAVQALTPMIRKARARMVAATAPAAPQGTAQPAPVQAAEPARRRGRKPAVDVPGDILATFVDRLKAGEPRRKLSEELAGLGYPVAPSTLYYLARTEMVT
jgi:ATPase family associated with various cellular activities (AAA)